MDGQNNRPQAEDFQVTQNHYANDSNAWEINYYEGYTLKVFSSVKKILEWIITNTEISNEETLSQVVKIESVLNFVQPTKLMQERNRREDDGTTLQELIESTLSLIRAKGPPAIDIETFVAQLQTAEDPSVRSELYIRAVFQNINYRYQEMEEVLARADGHQDEMFMCDDESPFLFNDFIGIQYQAGKIYIYRMHYSDEEFPEISEECVEPVAKKLKATDGIKNDQQFMADLTKEVNLRIEDHEKNFNNEDYLNKHSIHDLLMKVIEYLTHLKKMINIDKFAKKQELDDSINYFIIHRLSFMLHSLPLDKLLNLDINATKKQFNDLLCIISDILVTVDNGSRNNALIELKMIVHQICIIIKRDNIGCNALRAQLYAQVNTLKTQADIVTSESLEEWKDKFEDIKNKEDVLRRCPHDTCYICFDKFADILEDSPASGDLAAMHTCLHLFCLRCMTETVRRTPDK